MGNGSVSIVVSVATTVADVVISSDNISFLQSPHHIVSILTPFSSVVMGVRDSSAVDHNSVVLLAEPSAILD